MLLRPVHRVRATLLPFLISRRRFFTFPSSLGPFGQGPGQEDDPNDNMQQYHERKIMPYTRKQLYELVADVDAYRYFIPFCTSSTILKASRSDWKTSPGNHGDPPIHLEAELKVGFLGIDEAYVSKVECRPFESVQAIASTSTPLFKKLVTTWRFQDASPTLMHPATLEDMPHAPGGRPSISDQAPTLLTFDIAFAFSSPLHAAVSKGFFGRVTSMMVTAFEERCLEVYGKPRL